jgi:hypothetical protein
MMASDFYRQRNERNDHIDGNRGSESHGIEQLRQLGHQGW